MSPMSLVFNECVNSAVSVMLQGTEPLVRGQVIKILSHRSVAPCQESERNIQASKTL